MKNTIKRSTVLRLTSLASLASIAAVATGCAREPQMQPNVPSTEVTTEDATYNGSANTMPTTARTVTPPPAARTTPAPAPATNNTSDTSSSVSTPPPPANATRDAHAKPGATDADRAAAAPATPPANGTADGNTRSDADNTRVNARDRHGANPTPLDQGNGKDDIRITADIRKGVVSDSSLSFTAKNVKIITTGGKVVLRGPVKSAQERATIEAKARATAGVSDVDNQLEVKP